MGERIGMDMAAAQRLSGMFPSIDGTVVESVLEASNQNLEEAVEILLGMTAADADGSASHGVPAEPERDHSQLELDEALARQLQEQFILEHDEREQQHWQLQASATHPQSQPPPLHGLSGTPNQLESSEGSVSDGLSSIGGAVYAAGEATAVAASSLVSGLWSWATAPAEAAAPLPPHTRAPAAMPVELVEVGQRTERDARAVAHDDPRDGGCAVTEGGVRRRGGSCRRGASGGQAPGGESAASAWAD